MNLVEATLTKDTKTANGMATNSTSLNKCLDLFFIAGASRNMSKESIESMFLGALGENPDMALKILFWARDIRGGAGERRFFRICMYCLSENFPQISEKVTPHIPEYGRWDDIFWGDTDTAIQEILWGLGEANALCAKWMPRKGPVANQIRKAMGMTPKEYRKTLVALTNVIETRMCKKEWNQIGYKTVPSKAFAKYRNAFYRNDPTRFEEFLSDVKQGKTSINAGAIFPNDIIKPYLNRRHENDDAINEQWNALPNYMEGSKERIIPVCDVSGSMSGLPMEVSVSLGLYISERNEGIFKDAFMTFSAQPQMQYLKGGIWERTQQLLRADWGMNTNLQATFDLILNKAIENKVPQSEMPTKILIISDMEFDQATSNNWNDHVPAYNQSAIEMIRGKYETSGYTMPGIVFWNVNGRQGNIPVGAKDENTALVSGFSPSILKSILSGEIESPTQIMLKTINTERYKVIHT